MLSHCELPNKVSHYIVYYDIMLVSLPCQSMICSLYTCFFPSQYNVVVCEDLLGCFASGTCGIPTLRVVFSVEHTTLTWSISTYSTCTAAFDICVCVCVCVCVMN